MPTLSRHTKAITARALEARTTMGGPDGLGIGLCVVAHMCMVLYSSAPVGTFLEYLGAKFLTEVPAIYELRSVAPGGSRPEGQEQIPKISGRGNGRS
jgi:hypothetical protein